MHKWLGLEHHLKIYFPYEQFENLGLVELNFGDSYLKHINLEFKQYLEDVKSSLK